MNKPKNIYFRQITGDKKQYLSLLLLADPDEEMIDRYLEVGEMFVLETENDTIAEAVVVEISETLCEVKNLAVEPRFQHQGYGTLMLQYLADHYRGRYRTMQVGTSNPTFYEKAGFTYSHTLTDFFLKNYPEPIFDEGIQCIDMIYIKRVL